MKSFLWERPAKKVLLLAVMLMLAGFTVINEELKDSNSAENTIVLQDIYADIDSFQIERSIIQFVDMGTMLSSWYGPRFHGRLTANGEIYDQMAFTAAHKTLRFGTILKLTNPKNKKSIIVRINDRGPYFGKRELDLSKGAAIALGVIKPGVIKLKVAEVTISDENRPLIAFN